MKIQDPLFLLTEQAGMSLSELSGEAAAGVVEVNKLQEAIKTGEPIPILFARYRNENGGVMVQPKMSEGFFSNDIEERENSTDGGSNTFKDIVEVVQVKYLLVVSQGEMPPFQERDLFHGNCRRGTYNQAYSARAGTWDPGNEIGDFITETPDADEDGNYSFDLTTLSEGESARLGDTIYYKYQPIGGSNFLYHILDYRDYGLPIFCGTSGSYEGITTLSFEYEYDNPADEDVSKCVSLFIRNGITVTRLVDGVTNESDNFVDLAKYLVEANNRLPADLIDTAALTIAAKFTDTNSFLFNGAITQSTNLLDWLQKTSAHYLLKVTDSGGKFGLIPRLPYNADFTIKTTKITPEFTFTEEHVAVDGFEMEYISLQDREPVCYVVEWRQQPLADFGLVRTVEVRNTGEAEDGPFVDIDMSDYCTRENHAVKVGAYYLATRKYVTHHLRLTVRERSYNVALVVGDIVRVRLRRETSEGDVEYHDKLYEINRIEKTFESRIIYDLTHFPVDSLGRSIVARAVAAASGEGNDIDLGRATFDCDEVDANSTTEVGTSTGGGGDDAPDSADTSVDLDAPLDADGTESSDTPFFDPQDNPDDPLDDPEPTREIGGYTDTPGLGDELTFDPGCADPLIKWYKIDINTGAVTKIGEGVSATLEVTAALQQEGVTVYAEGCCPDPSQPGGYAVCKKSDEVDVFDEIIDCPGGGQSGGQGTFTKVINVGTAYPASFTFTYTAYTIQDRFVISGAASLDTGYVSGTNKSVTVNKTSADPYITVTVYAPTSGTAWNYSVGCAS